ncbi:MAG: triose-phosphate isomerase [Patescibacteria group bacterium]
MNKPIAIANWKMNLTSEEEVALVEQIKDKVKTISGVDVVICPSFIGLSAVGEVINKTNIKLGAQDVFWQERGPYTGAISPRAIKEAGGEYVIIGHSERRKFFGETNELINKKIAACLDYGLTPIVCLGETLNERQDGRTDNVILGQLNEAFLNIDLVDREEIIISYEPVWAIGTGHIAGAETVSYVLNLIEHAIFNLWPNHIAANNLRLIYGGSVEGGRIDEFIKLDLLNGFLVGGASLDADKFIGIINKITAKGGPSMAEKLKITLL